MRGATKPTIRCSETLVLTAVMLISGSGCGRSGEIVLHQPFAPGTQREMTLKSRWTYYATDDGRQRCLAAFPRPNGAQGARDFLLFIDAPDRLGTMAVGGQDPQAVRGFLIQDVGNLRGKCEFTGGTIRVRNVLLRPLLRRIDLDVYCDDDTHITGTTIVERVPHELRSFERRYASDVAALATSSTTSKPSDTGTGPRGRRSP